MTLKTKLPRKGYLAISIKTNLVYEIVQNDRKNKRFKLSYPPFAEFPDFYVSYDDFESQWTYEKDRDRWGALMLKKFARKDTT